MIDLEITFNELWWFNHISYPPSSSEIDDFFLLINFVHDNGVRQGPTRIATAPNGLLDWRSEMPDLSWNISNGGWPTDSRGGELCGPRGALLPWTKHHEIFQTVSSMPSVPNQQDVYINHGHNGSFSKVPPARSDSCISSPHQFPIRCPGRSMNARSLYWYLFNSVYI